MVGPDDLVRLLTYHWARDTSTFPTEAHRLDLATLILFQSFTGCRLAEPNYTIYVRDVGLRTAILEEAILVDDNTALDDAHKQKQPR